MLIPVALSFTLALAMAAQASDAPQLRAQSGEASLATEARSFCWPSPGEPHPACHDGPFVANPRRFTTISRERPLTLTFPHDTAPRVIRIQVWEPLPPGADVRRTPHGKKVTEHLLQPLQTATWTPALAPGRYVISVGAFWEDRSAAWVLGVEVAGAGVPVAPAAAAAGTAGAAFGALALYVITRRRDHGSASPAAEKPSPLG